ncbi:hypothetical protein JDV02_005089 [Purpureocillium takamizusanense]|uniref:Zn(2)-C6 fungal-type domain-containing protein n=2 Tax=Purpureocillium takamizusanense TaxID=2060973 RepID=A0A9Q8VA01_9HYPO|nr:uncharacterized protein JDV02_005089 [Purpureocillium takamizusanense]UNI18845.1 hypothetical protein JDV02_005089 [Purpureocillium takamizusanense]
MASQSSDDVEAFAHRPAFRVRSEFGGARQWRSRKSRPCDACRRRKTACIIETSPPCRFCESRGIPCEASQRSPPTRRRPGRPEVALSPESLVARDGIDAGPSTAPGNAATFTSHRMPGPALAAEVPHHSRHSQSTSEGYGPDAAAVLPSPQTNPSDHGSELSEKPVANAPPPETRRPDPAHGSRDPSVLTLEDGERRHAHCIGLAGEQDTDLLASFRSVIVNETNKVDAGVVQVFAGNPLQGEPPVHFNIVMDDFIPHDNIARDMASDAIESLAGRHGPRLVSLYFQHVHPANCIVSKARFLRAYAKDKLSIPASLRGVVYALGATFWHHDPSPHQEVLALDLRTLLEQAHYSLHREYHAPNLWNLQASLLLVHERPGHTYTMETPRTWVLSSSAVASAQMVGLHREPKLWSIAPWEKSLRRRLWYATYMTDVWSSVCHGNPPHLHTSSFTTTPPQIDEMSIDEDVEDHLKHLVDPSSYSPNITASARFVGAIKLTHILHDLLDFSYSDKSYKEAATDHAARETRLLHVQRALETWLSLLPSCLSRANIASSQGSSNIASLHLAYFAVKTLLYRSLMWPVSMAAKRDPSSALRRYFDKAVADFHEFAGLIESINSQCLHGFWGAHARSHLVLSGNFLIYLFLTAPTPDEVQSTFRLLESVHTSLKRLRGIASNEDAVALLRPVVLRMDTLFTQASRIMSSGSTDLREITLSGVQI